MQEHGALAYHFQVKTLTIYCSYLHKPWQRVFWNCFLREGSSNFSISLLLYKKKIRFYTLIPPGQNFYSLECLSKKNLDITWLNFFFQKTCRFSIPWFLPRLLHLHADFFNMKKVHYAAIEAKSFGHMVTDTSWNTVQNWDSTRSETCP